ncbi:MAG: hypothetical protein AAFV69_00305 [Pseudomonadota bacterium]
MGWIFTSGYDGTPLRDWFDHHFTQDNGHVRYEIVESALVKMRTYYAACRRTDRETGDSIVFALVVKVKYVPKATDGMTLGWKDMDEGMLPDKVECPLAILDLLDPPDPDRYGGKWREQVRAWHARRKAKPKPGEVFVLKSPLAFTDGSTGSRFRVEKRGRSGRGRAYRNLDNGGLYRIAGLENLEFVIEDNTEREETARAGIQEALL